MNWLSALGLDTSIARYRSLMGEFALAAEDRVALAKLEWDIQRTRLLLIVVCAMALGVLTVVAMVMMSVALLVHFWDAPNRTVVAWCIACGWTLLWGGVLWALLHAVKNGQSPFMHTRLEIARDWQALKGKL